MMWGLFFGPRLEREAAIAVSNALEACFSGAFRAATPKGYLKLKDPAEYLVSGQDAGVFLREAGGRLMVNAFDDTVRVSVEVENDQVVVQLVRLLGPALRAWWGGLSPDGQDELEVDGGVAPSDDLLPRTPLIIERINYWSNEVWQPGQPFPARSWRRLGEANIEDVGVGHVVTIAVDDSDSA